MLEGRSVIAKSPDRWTDVKLALALTAAAAREDDEFAPNTVGNWRKAKALPKTVLPLIAVFFGDSDAHFAERRSFQDLFNAAQLEKWGPLKAKATDRAGPVFVATGRKHIIDRTSRETDALAARDSKQQALQATVLRSAERLAVNVEARGIRYSNTPIWRELAIHARRLADIASLEPKDLIVKLSDAYDASLYLGGRLELDDRILKDIREEPSLDLDVRGDLVHLVRLAAPWLRGFPSVRKLDDQAARTLTDLGDMTSARDLVEHAARAKAIPEDDAREMRTLAEAAEAPEFLGRKARRRLVGGARNLALSLAETEVERQAETLDLSDIDTRALATATYTTLIVASSQIDRLQLPEDIRSALRAVVDEAASRPMADPTTPDASTQDVEALAKILVLRGLAPPKAWRQRIKRLNFAGSPLVNATPLADLTALTSLDLSRTQIADATPLAGLTSLTSLDLSRTQIADATPLAGLVSLTSLNLFRTLVTDATPLAGLTALTSLSSERYADHRRRTARKSKSTDVTRSCRHANRRRQTTCRFDSVDVSRSFQNADRRRHATRRLICADLTRSLRHADN